MRFEFEQFSIYSYRRLQELWLEGNPFAWHLSIEARLLYSSSNADYLESLEVPAKYCKSKTDCERFVVLFHQASIALESSSSSQVLNCQIFIWLSVILRPVMLLEFWAKWSFHGIHP